MDNILSFYKDKAVSKELAVSLVIKFAKQEGILYEFLEEIKKIKPYKKGNDNVRYVVNYAVGIGESYGYRYLSNIFLLPCRTWLGDDRNISCSRKWEILNRKWWNIIGDLKIKT